MVDWRAWPKEKGKLASPRSAPAWTRTPERLKETQREMLLALPIMVAAIAGSCAPMFVLFALFAPSGKGTVAMFIALGGMVLLLGTIFLTAAWGEGWTARRRTQRVRQVLQARGEARLDDEIVGVQYSGELWRDPMNGDSWDWGALRLDVDRLVFTGRDSRFELLPNQIVGLEIRRFDYAMMGPVPRLYVTWSEGDATDVLSLDLPHIPSRRRRVEAIDDLRERIERWRQGPTLVMQAPTNLPLRETDLRSTVNPYTQIGKAAKMLGLAAALPITVISGLLLASILHYFGVGLGPFAGTPAMFGFVSWSFAANAIEKRLPPGLQHPSKRSVHVANLGDAIADVTESTRLRT